MKQLQVVIAIVWLIAAMVVLLVVGGLLAHLVVKFIEIGWNLL